METKVHGLEVDFELSCILLLLSDLLLLLVSQSGLLFLESLLSESSLLLSLLIFLLLVGVVLTELLHRYRLWLKHDLEELLFLLWEFFKLKLFLRLALCIPLYFDCEFTVWVFELLSKLPDSSVMVLSTVQL